MTLADREGAGSGARARRAPGEKEGALQRRESSWDTEARAARRGLGAPSGAFRRRSLCLGLRFGCEAKGTAALLMVNMAAGAGPRTAGRSLMDGKRTPDAGGCSSGSASGSRADWFPAEDAQRALAGVAVLGGGLGSGEGAGGTAGLGLGRMADSMSDLERSQPAVMVER